MVKKISERLIWADIVRIIAIFFVVLVHSVNVTTTDFISFPLSSPIAATCVPLFVLLSGSLLLNKDEGYILFYKKRLTRLLLPWITWSLIYFALSYLKNPVPNFSQLLTLFSTSLTSFWFLPMITALYIITPALRIFVKAAKIRDVVFIISLLFLSISVLPFYKNSMAFPLFVDDGLVRHTFSYVGFYLAGFVLIKIKLPKIWILLFTLFLGMALSFAMYYFRSYLNLTSPILAFNYIAPGIAIASVSLFLIILSLTKNLTLSNNKIKSIITLLSTVSLGVYFVHGLISEYFFKIFGFSYTLNLPYATAWVNAFILFTISSVFIWGLTKIPFVKRFIT